MGDSGRELHPGDKQLAAGREEVQIMAAEIACSFATDYAEEVRWAERGSLQVKVQLNSTENLVDIYIYIDISVYMLLIPRIPAGFLIPVLFLCFSFSDRLARSNRESTGGTDGEATTSSDPPLRKCQQDCLEACAKGARKIEMACGTGKTRVMKELLDNNSGRVSCPVMKNLPEAGPYAFANISSSDRVWDHP